MDSIEQWSDTRRKRLRYASDATILAHLKL